MKGDTWVQAKLLTDSDWHYDRGRINTQQGPGFPQRPPHRGPLLGRETGSQWLPGFLEHRDSKSPDPPHPHDDPSRDQFTNGTLHGTLAQPSEPESLDQASIEVINSSLRHRRQAGQSARGLGAYGALFAHGGTGPCCPSGARGARGLIARVGT
jgi:hypothetical protein